MRLSIPLAALGIAFALAPHALADAPSLAPAPLEPAHEWRFAVSIDAIPVGEHRYVVTDEGEVRRVSVDARFRVHLLVVDAYVWEQHVDETWRGNCLASLASRTVEQGRVTTVAGHVRDDAFVVRGAKGEVVLPGCQMTFAYWNPQVLAQRELINAQTGEATPVEVEHLHDDTQAVRGVTLPTQHWRMRTARNTIELWYSTAGDWVAMRTTTRDGHVVVYRLV